MIGFPSDSKFIKLKKQCQELKILMSAYESSYQPMVNIFASEYIRIWLTIKFRFWLYHIRYCHLVSLVKISF